MRSSFMRRASGALRQFEERAFRLASEAEYRLRITPRNVRLQPSPFDRRILRLFVVAMPTLIASLFIDDRSFRIRVLFAELVILCVALALLLLLDAWPGTVRSGRRSPTAPSSPSSGSRFATAPPARTPRAPLPPGKAAVPKAPSTKLDEVGKRGSTRAGTGANTGVRKSPGTGTPRR